MLTNKQADRTNDTPTDTDIWSLQGKLNAAEYFKSIGEKKDNESSQLQLNNLTFTNTHTRMLDDLNQ